MGGVKKIFGQSHRGTNYNAAMADDPQTPRDQLLHLLRENRRLRAKAIREGLLELLPELEAAKADIEEALQLRHERGELW